MKALTLHQPWASLVAVGVKTIETRSWSTKYRGRLAIHAGARKPTMDAVYAPALAEGWRWLEGAGLVPLPLGAVVATCELVDVVPMVLYAHQAPGAAVILDLGSRRFLRNGHHVPQWSMRETLERNDALPTQYLYGDFTPGRYAWILDDIKPTTERCPLCWGSGSWPSPLRQCCPVCAGKLACDPVPAKGNRGLWEWKYTLPEVER